MQVLLEILLPHSRTARQNMAFLIKFAYGTLLWAHYFTCLWIWMGIRYLMHDNNMPWLIKNSDLGVNLNSYILIFYWLFTILATVGYGDFTGGTTAEYLVTIAIEFMGIIVFAFLVFLMN